MPSIEYYLFRLKITLPKQMQLFPDNLSRRETLQKALGEARALISKRDYVWHIGNVHRINEDANRLYFAIRVVAMKETR